MPANPNCANCRAALPAYSPASRLFCGAACRAKAHRARVVAPRTREAQERHALKWAEVRAAVAERERTRAARLAEQDASWRFGA